jgi:acylphosphatase
MKKAAKIVVSGIVQGVFYRQFIKDNAEEFKLKGFVRNLEDGNVEIIAEGEGENIKKMVEACKKGPSHAQIRNVSVEERNYSGDFKEFKVLRI